MITTKEDIKRATEVMLAYAQGKTIQRQDPDGKWVDCVVPMFDWAGYNYRIKPQLTDIQPNQWISVEDDLPCNHLELICWPEIDEGTETIEVFARNEHGDIWDDYMIYENGKWRWNDFEPDFWMIAPKLPK